MNVRVEFTDERFSVVAVNVVPFRTPVAEEDLCAVFSFPPVIGFSLMPFPVLQPLVIRYASEKVFTSMFVSLVVDSNPGPAEGYKSLQIFVVNYITAK